MQKLKGKVVVECCAGRQNSETQFLTPRMSEFTGNGARESKGCPAGAMVPCPPPALLVQGKEVQFRKFSA